MQIKERITDVGAMTDKFLTFRLRGKKHEVTLFELGKLLGLYSEKDLSNKDLKFLIITGVRNKSSFDAHGYWKQISTEDNLEYGKSKVSSIKTPLLRVLHRILVQSILHRTSDVEFVLEEDLWVMNALAEKRYLQHLNATWIIVEHLRKRSAVGTLRGSLYFTNS